jgi:hypothetical protein
LLLREEVELVGFGKNTAGRSHVEQTHDVGDHVLGRLPGPALVGGGNAPPDRLGLLLS